MKNKIIRDYNIGDIANFKYNNQVKIIDYAGTIMCHITGENFEVQLYKVLYNNEEYYASNFGLNSGDPNIFKKVIGGIGYRGKIDFFNLKKEYKTWKDMIYRCYNPNNNLFPYYGAIGITVCPRWHCFEMFLYDLINIDGYEAFANPNNKRYYELDIDSKQSMVPSNCKYYGPGVVSLKLFYSSDVGINVKKNREHLNQDFNIQRQFTPSVNGDYNINDYKFVVNNHPNFQRLNNDPLFTNTVYRTLHGVTYRGNPITEPYVQKKVMCVKI